MAFTRDLKSLIVDDFRAEHAVAILAKHDDPSRWEEQARIIEESGEALTVFIDDQPAMCVGIIDIWEGGLEIPDFSALRPVTDLGNVIEEVNEANIFPKFERNKPSSFEIALGRLCKSTYSTLLERSSKNWSIEYPKIFFSACWSR